MPENGLGWTAGGSSVCEPDRAPWLSGPFSGGTLLVVASPLLPQLPGHIEGVPLLLPLTPRCWQSARSQAGGSFSV